MESDTAQEVAGVAGLEEVLCAGEDISEGLQLCMTHTRAVTALTDCIQANLHWNRGTPEGPQPWVIHTGSGTPSRDCH